MSRKASTVYVGNLDDRVPDRVLYEILVQAGRIVDLHIPREKESNRHRGFAFVEYESEEIADYAVKLFSGLVRLYNKTLKFAISGQDKSSTSNRHTPVTPNLAPLPSPNFHSLLSGDPPSYSHSEYSKEYSGRITSNGLVSNSSYEYTRRVFGSVMDDVSRHSPRQPVPYSS